MIEDWKNVKEFEGYYQVSNLANVRRIRPTVDCGVEVLNHLKPQLNKGNNRINITLSNKNVSKSYVLASLVHDTFLPDREGLKYKFKDGDPTNMRLDNFELFEQKRWDGKNNNTQLTKMILAKRENGKKSIKELGIIFGMSGNAVRYHVAKSKSKV